MISGLGTEQDIDGTNLKSLRMGATAPLCWPTTTHSPQLLMKTMFHIFAVLPQATMAFLMLKLSLQAVLPSLWGSTSVRGERGACGFLINNADRIRCFYIVSLTETVFTNISLSFSLFSVVLVNVHLTPIHIHDVFQTTCYFNRCIKLE